MSLNTISVFIKSFDSDQWNRDTLSIKYFYFMLFFYVALAWFSEGYSHADEHYQILEFAAYKIHQYPYIYPWELNSQIRPTLQVWVVVWLYKTISFFIPQVSPFFIAFLTRAIAGLLSAISCYLFVNAFKDEFNSSNKKKWFYLLSAFSFTVVYCAVRYSSETMSADLFMIGFSLIFYKRFRENHVLNFFIGSLLGAAFITRYQIGVMIFGLIAWLVFYRKIKFSVLTAMISGLTLIFLLGIYLDSVFYGQIVCTAWRYFEINILQDRASTFGKSYWTYLEVTQYFPFGLLYILSSLFFIVKQPKHVITWILVPFILIHMLIPHKEMRFLIPVLGYMGFVIMYTIQILQVKNSLNFSLTQHLSKMNKVFWPMNCLMGLIGMMIVHQQFGVYKFFWQQPNNKLIYLNLFTKKNTLYADNSVVLNMPLRFYLSDKIYTKNYNQREPFYCEKNASCFAWLPCFKKLLIDSKNMKLVYDSCPNDLLRKKINFGRWMDRTALLKHNGRVYKIKA